VGSQTGHSAARIVGLKDGQGLPFQPIQEHTPMKFPYGISNFATIRLENYFYQDRTGSIPDLEEAGKQLLFLRPRRFGKSLLITMLENYYDLRRADDFQTLFGSLAIGQNPTPLHNQYIVLHWDFSVVKSQGDIKDIELALHRTIAGCIHRCARQYHLAVDINPEDGIYSFGNLLTAIQETGHKLYLFIDEYDNFANEILVAKQEQYESLMYGDGLFRTLFKAVKAAASQGLDRVFITGVSPVAMSDITSGYNVAENIYIEPQFNALCGFTEHEISTLLQTLASEQTSWSVQEALAMMRTFYNGYRFSEDNPETVYNPTLCLYFMKALQGRKAYPRKILDDNLSMDRNRLIYLAGLLEGEPLLIEALIEGNGLTIPGISSRFGIVDMLKPDREKTAIISLLYYFGVLTLDSPNEWNEWRMKIPNLVSRSLYIDQLRELYLPAARDRDALKPVRDALFRQGDIQPACAFLETRLFQILSNRDYRWTNELAIKLLFMMMLYDDLTYMMVSEIEVNHGYADLSFIVRPDWRQYKYLDLVLEFKYVNLKDLRLSGEDIRDKTQEELMKISLVSAKLAEAENQAMRYGDTLKDRYKLDTITRFAVVALELERVVYRML
jgi:hypothetical protein